MARCMSAISIGALATVTGFMGLVYLLHVRLRRHILLALPVTLVAYCLLALSLARVLPDPQDPASALWFGVSLLGTGVLGILLWTLPPRQEPGHRSQLPLPVKAPLVFAIVLGVVLAKDPLRGFMPAFPFATVFACYEARTCLYTLIARFAIFLLAILPMLAICRWLIPAQAPLATCALGLGAAWLAYVPLYLCLDRLYVRRSVR